MKKAPAPAQPAGTTSPTPLDPVIAAMQRSMETALAEQCEHGRLLRQIVADTTQSLLAEPPFPAELGTQAAASVEKIRRLTAQHRQRADELATAVKREMEALRTRATPAKQTSAKSP